MMKTSFAFTLVLTACVTAPEDAATCAEGRCDSQDVEVADDLPAECSSSEIVRIERPVYGGDSNDDFAYGFRFKAPTTPGAPTIVYLPGGPGQSSMATPPEFVPEGWGYLMTDPRGVGCNRLAQLPVKPGDFFSTEQLANDVIAAIVDRGLSHYILFGISYGTALGTTVAHELEARNLAKPDAVVLEGVLGKTFGRDDSNFPGAEYIKQWERVRAVLPADVRTELDTADKPYGFDANGWSKILMATLPRGPGETLNLLAALSSEQPADVRDQIHGAFAEMAEAPDPARNEDELYRQIACREIMDTVPDSGLDVVFDRGALVRNRKDEGTKCRELHVDDAYDSARLPFSMPLFLFIGDSDTATPAWQGAYHFEHHQGRATSIVTKNGGHNSLELNQVACAPALMAAIADGGSLDAAAASCPMPTTITRK